MLVQKAGKPLSLPPGCTVARLKLKGIGGGAPQGEACGSIGVNAGNLTGGDSRVKVKLKTLLDKLRGGAWPSPLVP